MGGRSMAIFTAMIFILFMLVGEILIYSFRDVNCFIT